MVKKSTAKIHKNDLTKNNLKVQKTNIEEMQQFVKYSFKYFHKGDDNFYPNKGTYDAKYLHALLDRLFHISNMKFIELESNRSKALRAHSIDWKDTSKPLGFEHIKTEIVERPYQFSISSNEHGRVHGFFINTTFYIVWLDPEHKLYI